MCSMGGGIISRVGMNMNNLINKVVQIFKGDSSSTLSKWRDEVINCNYSDNYYDDRVCQIEEEN